MILFIPLQLLVAAALCFLLPLYHAERLRYSGRPQELRAAKKRARRKFWKLILFSLFLICKADRWDAPTC